MVYKDAPSYQQEQYIRYTIPPPSTALPVSRYILEANDGPFPAHRYYPLIGQL